MAGIDALDDLLDADVVEPPRGAPEGGGAGADGAARLRQAHRLRYRSLVRNAPVVGFTGANGAGKTLVAVSEAIHDMALGRPVVSTVPIKSAYGESVPLRSLRQLLELRDCTVLLDEVSVVLSSRSTGSLSEEVVTFLQSMRHQGVTLRWTAPAWMRADVLLREVTQVSVNVSGLIRHRRPGQFWPTPRVVLAGALDCVGIPVDAKPEHVIGRRLWIPHRLPGWGAYDSEADVSRIGWQRQSGTCLDCGGSIRREPCTDDRHEHLGLPPRVASHMAG